MKGLTHRVFDELERNGVETIHDLLEKVKEKIMGKKEAEGKRLLKGLVTGECGEEVVEFLWNRIVRYRKTRDLWLL